MPDVSGLGTDATYPSLTEPLRVSGTGADVQAHIPTDAHVDVTVSGTGADIDLRGDGTVTITASGTGATIHVGPELRVQETDVSGLGSELIRHTTTGTETVASDDAGDGFTYESDNVHISASQSSTVRVNGKIVVSDGDTRSYSSDGRYNSSPSTPTIQFDCEERDDAFERSVSTGFVAGVLQAYTMSYDAPCTDVTECPGCGEALGTSTAVAHVTETGYALLERYGLGIDRQVESYACSSCC